MSFNDKLKELRKENKLSQEQLAEKLNISRQAISKWESGKAYPDIDNLILLAKILEVSLDELLIDEKNKYSEDVEEENESKIDADISSHKSIWDIRLKAKGNNSNQKEADNETIEDIKLNPKHDEDEEHDDDISINLIVGGFIIGTAIGTITDNFMWGSALAFVGMGIGYIIESFIKKK